MKRSCNSLSYFCQLRCGWLWRTENQTGHRDYSDSHSTFITARLHYALEWTLAWKHVENLARQCLATRLSGVAELSPCHPGIDIMVDEWGYSLNKMTTFPRCRTTLKQTTTCFRRTMTICCLLCPAQTYRLGVSWSNTGKSRAVRQCHPIHSWFSVCWSVRSRSPDY